ncbi:hypothetical protein RER_18990 [Rhodococcus erythropolis PR4]|uniref:Uncharacterized protein n=1 Tax=Rhodococcus erythropolis (strain PR4 / NBRC 100887) TaxID=234621 RepID=C0ZW72_RHOE4|nr:hypothetical protein RER_18990 [Rhodococcus erythropolis PR4]
MFIRLASPSTFDPSATIDGNDILLTFSADLTVELPQSQAERLAAVLETILGATT